METMIGLTEFALEAMTFNTHSMKK
jgi:hypothetical protein